MNTDNTMVSVAEVDENMAIIQQKMSLMIDTHQNQIDKLKKQLIEEQDRSRKLEEELEWAKQREGGMIKGQKSLCRRNEILKEENERLAKSASMSCATIEELKMLRKEVATLKEGEIAHLGKIDLLQHQLAGGVLHTPLVVQDINGKDVKVPSEEECQQMFGVSQEEFIMLAKDSDCQY